MSRSLVFGDARDLQRRRRRPCGRPPCRRHALRAPRPVPHPLRRRRGFGGAGDPRGAFCAQCARHPPRPLSHASPAWWPSPADRRAERLRRALWEMVDDLVARRRDRDSQGDLLSLLLTARDPETGAALDDAAMRAHALTILLAGHETTGSSLAFTLHLLGRHQAVQDRVRQEVTEVHDPAPKDAAQPCPLARPSPLRPRPLRRGARAIVGRPLHPSALRRRSARVHRSVPRHGRAPRRRAHGRAGLPPSVAGGPFPRSIRHTRQRGSAS